MTPVEIALLPLAVLGHLGLTVAVANRVNSLGWPRKLVKSLDRLIYLAMGLLLAWVGWYFLAQRSGSSAEEFYRGQRWLAVYLACSAGCGLVILGAWIYRRILRQPPRALLANHSQLIDIAQVLGSRPIHGPRTQVLSRVPFNQLLKLAIVERELQLPRLPAALDGLTIAHISDFHFTGRVGLPYFQEVMRLTNELDCDLVAITGDLFDRAWCIEWVEDAVSKLRSRLGIFYILGNHDLRTGNVPLVRSTLNDAGLINLGGTFREIEVRGERIVLAGNERPWIKELPDMGALENQVARNAFRILLSHAPDQIGWARRHAFDLVLTGHTHGGQICFPLVGPIVCPSRYGVRYASGVFELPPSVMHVTRGVSCKTPLRINCPPEIIKLVLRAER